MGTNVSSRQVKSYSGRFRYHVEFGKGLVISRIGVPVYEFDGTSGGASPLNLYSAKDNSIVIALENARRSKRLALHLPSPSGISTDPGMIEHMETIAELAQIYKLATPFFLSFAVEKNSGGKKIEMLVLRDDAATVGPMSQTREGRLRYDFVLKAPVVKPVSLDR